MWFGLKYTFSTSYRHTNRKLLSKCLFSHLTMWNQGWTCLPYHNMFSERANYVILCTVTHCLQVILLLMTNIFLCIFSLLMLCSSKNITLKLQFFFQNSLPKEKKYTMILQKNAQLQCRWLSNKIFFWFQWVEVNTGKQLHPPLAIPCLPASLVLRFMQWHFITASNTKKNDHHKKFPLTGF